MQWLGSREQRQIAKVGLQVLVSFTPLPSRPATAAQANGTAQDQRCPRVTSRSSDPAAGQEDAGEPANPRAASSAEEAVRVQTLERQSSQEGVSTSGRNAAAWQDSPGPEDGPFKAFGSALELHKNAPAESEAAPESRLSSSGRRISGSLIFTPASRQQEAAARAGPGFAFVPHSSSDHPMQPILDFGAQLAAGHASAGLPRLAEAFPAAAPSLQPEAALPPAASWRLPSSYRSKIRPTSVVTGIPVMPLNAINPHQATANGRWAPWDSNEDLQRVQAAAPLNSSPQIDALIHRAERLRAEMTAAVRASVPRASSQDPPRSKLGAWQFGSPVQAITAAAERTKTAPIKAVDIDPVAGKLVAEKSPRERAKQAAGDRAGRLRAAAQRKRTRLAEAGAAANPCGGSSVSTESPRHSAATSAQVPAADIRAGNPGRSRPHSAADTHHASPAPTRLNGLAGDIAQVAPPRSVSQGTKDIPTMPQKAGASSSGGRAGGQERGAAVMHAFEVTIVRVAAAQGVLYRGAESSGPCYVCYHFPGAHVMPLLLSFPRLRARLISVHLPGTSRKHAVWSEEATIKHDMWENHEFGVTTAMSKS